MLGYCSVLKAENGVVSFGKAIKYLIPGPDGLNGLITESTGKSFLNGFNLMVVPTGELTPDI